MSITYDSPMNVKNEIPTGSVTWINGTGFPIPRWWSTLSTLTLNHPEYLNQGEQSQLGGDGHDQQAFPGPMRYGPGGPGDPRRSCRSWRPPRGTRSASPTIRRTRSSRQDEDAPALGEGREQPVAKEDDPEEDCEVSSREEQPVSPSCAALATRDAYTLGRLTIHIL